MTSFENKFENGTSIDHFSIEFVYKGHLEVVSISIVLTLCIRDILGHPTKKGGHCFLGTICPIFCPALYITTLRLKARGNRARGRRRERSQNRFFRFFGPRTKLFGPRNLVRTANLVRRKKRLTKYSPLDYIWTKFE